MKNKSFILQGSILAAAGIIVRLIGLIYKIPMTRAIGDEGIGYYNTAYEIYNIGLILSSYSLPLALSKVIAGQKGKGEENVREIFFCALSLGLFSGTLMTALLFFGADAITSGLFNSPHSALALKVMSPTVFIFSVMGVMRGYFQGHGDMVPTSVSQIIEQIVNAAVSVAASVGFMRVFAQTEVPAAYGAAGGTLGTLSGAFASLIFLSVLMLFSSHAIAKEHNASQKKADRWGLFSLLLATLVPIILSQFVYQLSGAVDNSMFGHIMAGQNLNETDRLSLLGIYGGKYRLLTNVPVAIASALGTSMIPAVVRAGAAGDREKVKKSIAMTIKFNMLLAIPCAAGMCSLSGPILRFIFADSRDLPARVLATGSVAIIFFSLSTVTNAVLQGIDLMRKSVTHSAISLAVHVLLLYIMLSRLRLGIYGLVIGNITFALGVCILNWISIGRALGYRQEILHTFLLPALSSVLMAVFARFAYSLFYGVTGSNAASLLLAVPSAMVFYGVMLLVTGTLSLEELVRMIKRSKTK